MKKLFALLLSLVLLISFSVSAYADGSDPDDVKLPEAEITDITDKLTDADPELTFALNFKIKDFEEILQDQDYIDKLSAKYGHYYTDYVLTISGLSDPSVTFDANGGADGFLAGQYDAYSPNWLQVPPSPVTLNNGESIYIIGSTGFHLTLMQIATFVQDFDCGVYFTPEFLEANPNMVVTLELKVFTEDGNGNIIDDHSIAKNIFDVQHNWGEPTYNWAEDGSSCTASRSCVNGDVTETATASASAAVVKEATCAAKGETKYTATFTESWAEPQEKTIADIAIDPDAHNWDEWEVVKEATAFADGKAERLCLNNCGEKDEKILPATYEQEEDEEEDEIIFQSQKPAEDKSNPATGSSDFVNVAVALGSLSIVVAFAAAKRK